MDLRIRNNTNNLANTALLASAAIVLSSIEMMIPDIPFMLPGMKLGLSNIVIMYALETVSLGSTISIAIVKAVFALLTRGATAGAMSLLGGILSVFAMWALITIFRNKFGYIGIGILGAFFHNIGQIIIAIAIMGIAVFWYFPIIALSSIATGTITGIVVGITLPKITLSMKFSQKNADI